MLSDVRKVTAAAVMTLCASSAAVGAEPSAAIVEFYNASLNHYFITASVDEAAMLDRGDVVKGWMRTGVTWHAWANAADSPDIVPVCRFFGTQGSGADAGPNSHFYTASAAECDTVKHNPKWTYEGIAFYIALPQSAGCASGTEPIYRSFFAGADVSQSNHRFLPDLTMHEHMAPASVSEGVVMCSPLSTAQITADAARLLEQASFGVTDSTLAHVVSVGTQAYLTEQFAASGAKYSSNTYVPAGAAQTFCATDPNPTCARDYYSLFMLQNDFFVNAVKSSDQLRQRVAFALSQILVTSGLDINLAYGMAKYQQIFLDNAFGNYEDLLTKVTLSSVMGDYLNMVNNDKPSGTVNPNENYAREILQLFSLGVWQLNADGTQRLDSSGKPIPAYDQDEIEGFAHVFTGWTYPLLPGATQRTHNAKNFIGDMVPVPTNHDLGAKQLLNGVIAPAGTSITADLALAIHNIFMHPNVGPFIGRQLIQKLVTGDPTPQYVARITAVFNDNGRGVRGDLKAVVNAILTDPEARGDVKLDPAYGKLREPVLFETALARALNAQTDGVYLGSQSNALGQNLFYPASVFNYYPPNYTLPGTSLVAPEFAIENSSTALNRYNFANALSFTTVGPIATLPGAVGTIPNWSALQAVATDPAALLTKLDVLLLHGSMAGSTRSAILPAISAVSASDPLNRARTAFYLVATSPEFQVER